MAAISRRSSRSAASRTGWPKTRPSLSATAATRSICATSTTLPHGNRHALGRVHTARAQLQAGIPRRLLCSAVRGRETLMLSSAELVLWATTMRRRLLFGVFASARCAVSRSTAAIRSNWWGSAPQPAPLLRLPTSSAASFSPDRLIHSSCICRLSSTCAYAIA